jgi:hypothetical protein
MTRTNKIERFNDWSARWKEERKTIDAVAISDLWQQRIPRGWEREIWEGKLGYRKCTDEKGERRTEGELFKGKSRGFQLTFSDQETNADYRIEAIYHNMPLANQRKGQVIADAFGVLKTDKSARPLFIEIKVTANNPWFALVENLQQIRLARACAHKIQGFVHENSNHRVERGVWGLILAPGAYYEKHCNNLAHCKLLLDRLNQNALARVAFGISDFLAEGQIKIIAQNRLGKLVSLIDLGACSESSRSPLHNF